MLTRAAGARRTPCTDPRRDPDDWFADLREHAGATRPPDPKRTRTGRAVELCVTRCPVREACLRAAMRFEGSTPARYRYGIWGGLSPQARDALYREQRKAAGCPGSLLRHLNRGEEPCAAWSGDPPALAA